MNYVLKFMKRNILITLLQIIQLSVIFVVIAFMISTINYRMQYYTPVKDILSTNGALVDVAATGSNDYMTDSGILKKFPKVTNITGVKFGNLLSGDDSYNYYVYDDKIIDQVPLKLDKGDISTLKKTDKNYCLITHDMKYDVGDEIALQEPDEEDPEKYRDIIFTVAGIISDNQLIYGQMGCGGDYRNLYCEYRSDDGFEPFIIVSDNLTKKLKMTAVYSDYVVLNYPKDSYDKTKLIQKLSEDWATYQYSTDEMRENSNKYIYEELYTIFPIIICVMILTIFTAIIANAISSKRNLKKLGIMYLCGSTWKKCIRLSMSNSIIIGIVSFIISMIVLHIGKLTFWADTTVTLGSWQIISCITIMLIYISISMITPFLMIRKVQPRDVLKSE